MSVPAHRGKKRENKRTKHKKYPGAFSNRRVNIGYLVCLSNCHIRNFLTSNVSSLIHNPNTQTGNARAAWYGKISPASPPPRQAHSSLGRSKKETAPRVLLRTLTWRNTDRSQISLLHNSYSVLAILMLLLL